MPQFEYTAVASSGQTLNGLAPAESVLELDRILEGRGLTLTSAKTSKRVTLASAKRLKSAELVFFTTQLATLLSAGVPLLSGLSGIEKRMSSPSAREMIQRIILRLEGGSSLQEALEGEPQSFPLVYRECVRAGELSGALPEVLLRQSKFLEWARSIRATTTQALIYPAILVLAITGLILVLLAFVLPRIMTMMPGGRADLPLPTRIVMGASDFLAGNIALMLMAIVTAATIVYVGSRMKKVRTSCSRWILKIPRYGTLARMLATSRFASTASTLQSAGCDIGTVLDTAGSTCGQSYMTQCFASTASDVKRGNPITESLEKHGDMDSLLIQMTHIGESSGDLSGCWSQLADHYNEEVPRAVKWFLALLEPAILILAGCIVAFILLATILPIFTLYDSIG